ncbi:hypothetical protein N0V90_009116 [Kalmusia sp. IMI 367209]|nr:hypothetical protein N0V90_009116 [Kalmusia sp. IMI 367209]
MMSFEASTPRSSTSTHQNPLPSPTRDPPLQQHSVPVPALNVTGELRKLKWLAEATKTRIGNLEALFEPSALAQVTEIKRVMRDSHRQLERLQGQVLDVESAALLGEAKGEAWQSYQRLVRIEEKFRRAVNGAPEVEASRAATSTSYAPSSVRHIRQHSRRSSGRICFARSRRPTVEDDDSDDDLNCSTESSLHLWTWPDRQEWEQECRQLTSGRWPVAQPSLSPATNIENENQIPGYYQHSYLRRSIGRTDVGSTPASAPACSSRRTSSEDLTALPLFPAVPTGVHGEGPSAHFEGGTDSHDRRCAFYVEHGTEALPYKLTHTREEVQRSCEQEENFPTKALHDPDRKREGSVPGDFATYVILAGINDPSYFLPQLRFIKIHEAKRLKEWLVQEHHLSPSGRISRVEKVLHLIFILQEGWRVETVAVLFSRTPLQVQNGCRDVFSRLLEMHSETLLERYQPTCHHLWKITHKFMGNAEVGRWERYYGWKRLEVLGVLITLNMYIGRYRQQGRVALDGPYQHWWRHFPIPEAD